MLQKYEKTEIRIPNKNSFTREENVIYHLSLKCC